MKTVRFLMRFPKRTTALLALILLAVALAGHGVAAEEPIAGYAKRGSWTDTLLASRAALSSLGSFDRTAQANAIWREIEYDFPVEWDWALQDVGPGFTDWFVAENTGLEQKMIARALTELGSAATPLRRELGELVTAKATAADPRWLRLYVQACELRRAARLKVVLAKAPQIVFVKQQTIRPSFFAYTEGQSDAQNERHFLPGAALCLLEMRGLYGTVRVLQADPRGSMRDPAVSWDGQHVVFAWKKSLDDDDYHLYERTPASGHIRQLTSGLGFADYEPAFLPNGDLIFSSTRCVQTVDCWWTEVSNLYTCDADGRYLRRLSFDQVHSIYPQVLDDGRVVYTRWDYNDRGQIFPQGLFQMNPDGTGQTEFYANNSWFPTTIAHARGIPGTEKVVCIFTGHHSAQAGKLGLLDPSKGRHENTGAQLIAPPRETKAERIDSYGQGGELFQYPYALSETEFLVAYAPLGWQGRDRDGRRRMPAHFSVYLMTLDGRRELLVSDPALPCSQPVPLMPRVKPAVRPSLVDWGKNTGAYYLQDVYAGPGLAGVPRGTIKKLRVVALEFRAAGVGNNGSAGPGGAALISTPIAIGNGSWDVKIVLGDAPVREDGSAYFTAPARTPLYFQALDEKGYAVQTMRSWSTLQPGEVQSCVGCHEHKNSVPLASPRTSLALRDGAKALEPFHGAARGFSFPKEVQPILDHHCIACHSDREQRMAARTSPSAAALAAPKQKIETAFSLRGDPNVDAMAKRAWSDAYLNLTLVRPDRNEETRGSFIGKPDGRVVNWIGSQSVPTPLPPSTGGSSRSELISMLERGHKGVRLSRAELETIACWIDLFVPYCGDYYEANTWTEEDRAKYQRYAEKRKRMEAIEAQNLRELMATVR